MSSDDIRPYDADDAPDGEAEGRTRGLGADDLTRPSPPAEPIRLRPIGRPVGEPLGAAVSRDQDSSGGYGR